MKDIPLFTVTDGMASLILHEIPFRGEAYVWIRTVYGRLGGLMEECAGFCRAAGAEKVYFSGNADLSAYPVHAKLIYRSLEAEKLPGTEAVAIPTADPARWTEHYRRRFLSVPAAQSIPTPEGLYDIFLTGELVGIGQLKEDMILSIASLRPGLGLDCLCALAAQSQSPKLRLVCAEENLPAWKLYDKLGFSKEEVKEVWYSMK
ncbi:MAG: hypothetical protein IKT58_02400 [Oscillospiraceae bacterium]|nr:hypothetical protein [Oscillospiraceae bacterium]